MFLVTNGMVDLLQAMFSMMKNNLTSRSRTQRHKGLAGRSVSPRSALQPTASRAATQPEPHFSALRP